MPKVEIPASIAQLKREVKNGNITLEGAPKVATLARIVDMARSQEFAKRRAKWRERTHRGQ